MILHLENKEKQITINLNFIRFFGQKHSVNTVLQEHRQNQKLLIKYLIEYFAPNQEKGVQMVKNWFLQAFKEMDGEDTIDGQISVLNESYERFRKDYKLDNTLEVNPTIKKMNSFKTKKETMLRIPLGECIGLLLTGNFSLYHYGDSRAINILVPEGLLEGYRDILINKYFGILSTFNTKAEITLSELKVYDFVHINGKYFNVKSFLKFFNSKEMINISTYKDVINSVDLDSIVLRQGENILLVNTPISTPFDEQDFTILDIS